jgi:hypothetical protein
MSDDTITTMPEFVYWKRWKSIFKKGISVQFGSKYNEQ